MTGFFNVYKEAGYTSHDVVAIIKKLTKTKAGHTGTLDPQAEGVLPICIGSATKLASMITGQDKSYTAEVVLGFETDTGDTTGQILKQSVVKYDKDAICAAVESFRGPQLQIPPMYSAIKIDGKRLYKLAREGQTVERKPRAVEIMDINVLEHRPTSNTFIIDVSCSKGTYIRSLCSDIGKALGICATMGALLRTRSGAFSLDTAIKLAKLKEAAENGSLNKLLLAPEKVLPFSCAYVQPEGLLLAKNGNPIPLNMVNFENNPTVGKFWLYGPNESDDVIAEDSTSRAGEVIAEDCTRKAGDMIGLFAIDNIFNPENVVIDDTSGSKKRVISTIAAPQKLRPEVML